MQNSQRQKWVMRVHLTMASESLGLQWHPQEPCSIIVPVTGIKALLSKIFFLAGFEKLNTNLSIIPCEFPKNSSLKDLMREWIRDHRRQNERHCENKRTRKKRKATSTQLLMWKTAQVDIHCTHVSWDKATKAQYFSPGIWGLAA